MPLSTYTLGQAWGVNEGTRYIVSRNASTDEVKPALQSQQIHLQNNCGFVGRLINSLPVCVGDGDRYWWCLFDQEMTQLGPNNCLQIIPSHLHPSFARSSFGDGWRRGLSTNQLTKNRDWGARLHTYWVNGCLRRSALHPLIPWENHLCAFTPGHEMFQRMLGSSDSEKKKPGSCQMLRLTTGFIHKWTRWHPILLYTSYIWVGHASPSPTEGGPGFTRWMSLRFLEWVDVMHKHMFGNT